MSELSVTVEGTMFDNLKCKIGQFNVTPQDISLSSFKITGKIPLYVAEEICSYERDKRSTDIWCSGGLEGNVKYIDESGKIIVDEEKQETYKKFFPDVPDKYRFVKEPKSEGKPFILFLDVTSVGGLKLFTDTIKKYNLV